MLHATSMQAVMQRSVVGTGRATGQGPWCQTHPWLSVRSSVRSASRSRSSLCLLLSAGAPARMHMHAGVKPVLPHMPMQAPGTPAARACPCKRLTFVMAHACSAARARIDGAVARGARPACNSEDAFEELARAWGRACNAPSPCCEQRTSAQPAAGPCRPNLADTHHTPCMLIGVHFCRTYRRHKAYMDSHLPREISRWHMVKCGNMSFSCNTLTAGDCQRHACTLSVPGIEQAG